LLEKDYDIKVDRKAIKRNLMNLVDVDEYDINYSETIRINKDGEEETIYSDWYIEHDFDDSELRLLIDGLLFSKHIPYSQCKTLIKKLTGLSSTYFQSHVKHIQNLPESLPRNPELLYTIEILDEAINKKKKVSFNYTVYGLDKKKHPSLDHEGNPKKFTMNPYQMVGTNGRYYLVCNLEGKNDIANYRVDRITNIELLDEPVKSLKKVKGAEYGLNLPQHMAEHVYMFSGEGIRVKFRADKAIIDNLVDWFGTEFDIKELADNRIEVVLKVNETAMKCWALQFSPYGIEVVTPKSLRDSVVKDLKKSLGLYK
jgi:predicted DNA-binding transcriptional regulator YafY